MSDTQDTFWEQYGHFVGCTVRESNSAVGIVTGVTNDGEPILHIRRRNGKIDKRKPSEVHKTCACGKRALDSNGKVCPGHENCRPLACAPPEPEECPGPHDDGPLNYCPTCSWSRTSSATVATFDVARFRAGCDSPRDCNNPKRAEALAKGHSWPSCENCRAADEIERLRRQRDEAIAFVGRWFPDAFVADLKEIFNGE